METLESRLMLSVTLNTGAAALTQADGVTPLPNNSTITIIAYADGDGFGDLTQATDTFLGDADDVLIGHIGTDDSNGPGTLFNAVTYNDPALSGADLMLVWYDTPFSSSNTGPGAGVDFGTYRNDNAVDGSSPWVMPSDGSTIALTFLTSSFAGSNADSSGAANMTTSGGVSNVAPMITSSATASIAENETTVIDVNATDDSDSEGSGLTFSITGGADQAQFTIDNGTGAVAFASAPDFEAPADVGADNVYDLQVTVTDSGQLTDVQDIAVTVTDVNENQAPTVTVNLTAAFLKNAAGSDLPQNSTVVLLADADGDGFGNLTQATGSFQGDPDDVVLGRIGTDDALAPGTLQQSIGFHHPTIAGRDVLLVWYDTPFSQAAAGPGEGVAFGTYRNDSSVDGSAAWVVPSEGSTVSLSFLTTSASGSNADSAGVANQSTAGGVSNTAPTITSSATATVNENQTSANDVDATDDTDSEGNGLTYSISGGADQSLFAINSSTGVLTFNSAPDFEAPGDAGSNNVYDVQVTVTDSGALTDVQDIAITVADVAENTAPTIISSATFTADENQTAAGNVDSTDDSDAEGSGLAYSITGGADMSLFSINATGMITFNAAPDFEAPGDANTDNNYQLQVTVTDGGSLTDVQDITVTVQDVDETQAPTVTVNLTAAILTQADGSTPLPNDSTIVLLADADGDGFGDLDAATDTFLSDADDVILGRLALDGQLAPGSIQQAIGFHQPALAGQDILLVWYDTPFNSQATGPGTGVAYGTYTNSSSVDGSAAWVVPAEGSTVSLSFLTTSASGSNADTAGMAGQTTGGGGNQNTAPTITSSATFTADENQTAAGNVESTDDSDSEGSGLTYSITGGADMSLFSINATGMLTFNAAPDFEAPADTNTDNNYQVQVTVTDSGGLTDVQDVTVTVADMNEDQAPTVTINLTAALLFKADGSTALPDDSTIVLIADADGDGFGDLSAATETFLGDPDDVVLGRVALDGQLAPGSIQTAIGFHQPTLAGQDVLMVWYDTPYDAQASGPGTGVAYGTYTNTSAVDGSAAWVVPSEGSTVSLSFLTASANGSNADSVGRANLVSGGGSSNAAPSITSSATASVVENTTAVIDVESTDDSDSEGSGLTYSITGGADIALFSIDAGTGSLTFSAAPDFDVAGDANTDNVYEVTVTVTDSGALTGVQSISVTVTNENDNDPAITSASAVNADEDQTSTTIDVQATDADGDTEGNGLTFAISGGDDQGSFQIDQSTGELTFVSIIDFENPTDANTDNDYIVDVTVTDSGDRSTTQTITVSVQNVNEDPVISSSTSATVDEEQTAVIDVESFDDTNTEGNGLTYSITGGADQALFAIDVDTGVVTFVNAPDFESPADANADNNFELQVTVTDAGGLTNFQDFLVSLNDVPDGAPQFTSAATASVAENQNSAIDVNSTDDVDSEGSGITYSIGGTDAALFSIDSGTGVVTFNAAPDFEAPADSGADNVYDIQVTATDSEQNANTQDIAITVTNENDNSPLITSAATASVFENQTSATDVDSSDADGESEAGNGLTYSLTGGADQALFAIDSDTGVITFNAAPDFENAGDANADNDYEIEVTVTDGNAQTGNQTLTITVTNENEAPSITSANTATTAEESTAAIDVESTDDSDTEGNGLTYSLTGGADQALFSIDSGTGSLWFTAAPDFEAPADANTDNNYEVQVTVTDSGSLTAVQDITVTVTDVLDGSPTFTSAATANAAENQTAVIDVNTTDDVDSEGNGITYAITGGADQGLLSIDSGTGVVTFDAAPDFESAADANTDNVYEITVTATDSEQRSSSQSIAITVTNENDNDPIFATGTGFSAAENQTAIGDNDATDADGDTEGNGLTFAITGGEDMSFFNIDSSTGVISFVSAPDFEAPADNDADNTYEVTVTVSDSGQNTANQDLSIAVTNVNEAPSIDGGATVTAETDENTTSLTDLSATDPEGDTEGSGLTYSITGGADQALVQVDTNTGVLSFISAPDFEAPTDANGDNVYEVQVTVTDSGGLTFTQSGSVTVEDVNEAPTIDNNGGGANATVQAAEGQTHVTDVRSSDVDGETEGNGLSYSLTGGADQAFFSIDSNSGVLTFNAAPSFSAPADAGTDNTYDVQVTVTDGGALTDVQDIAVQVQQDGDADGVSNDVEAAGPNGGDGDGDGVQDSEQLNVTSLPSAADGTYVTIAAADGLSVANVVAADSPSPVDQPADVDFPLGFLAFDVVGLNAGEASTVTIYIDGDAGINSYFKYGVEPDNQTPHWYEFLYDGTTGAEILADRIVLHFVDGQRGDDDLTADGVITDPGTPAVSPNTRPEITSDLGGDTASVDAAENQTAVTNVETTDDNDSEGSGLVYSLTGGADQALFSIDSSTGALTFNAAPDFETPTDNGTDGVYDVQVTVTDSGNLTDVQDIAVTVTDVNEAPTLTSVTQNLDVVGIGETLTLTANGAADPESNITSVQFFRDANTDGVADTGELIAEDVNGADGFASDITVDWDAGDHTYLAVAVDGGGLTSAPVNVAGQVALRVDLGNRDTLKWTDADGTTSSIRLTNATGTAFFLGDNLSAQAAHRGMEVSGANLFLNHLDIDTAGNTRASVTTTARGGDDAFTMGDIDVTGSLTKIGGRGFEFDDMTVSGSLGQLQFGDLTGDHTIDIAGTGRTRMMGGWFNQGSVTVAGELSQVRVGDLGDVTFTTTNGDLRSFTAGNAGSLTLDIAGNIRNARLGDVLDGTIDTHGRTISNLRTGALQDVTINTGSLRSLTASGDILSSTINSANGVSSVRAANILGLDIIAGHDVRTIQTSSSQGNQGVSISGLNVTTPGSVYSVRGRLDIDSTSITAGGEIRSVSGKAMTDVMLAAGTRVRTVRATDVFNLSVNATEDAGRLTVSSWDGSAGNATNMINAGYVSAITSRGVLDVNINLNGTGARRGVLGNVRGTDISGIWNVAGPAGRITANNVVNLNASIAGDLSGVTTRGDFVGNLAATNIRSLSVRGTINSSFIAAGGSFGADSVLGGGDDVYGPGQIRSIAAGSILDTFISAGITPTDTTDIITNFDSAATVLNPLNARIGRVAVKTELSQDSRLVTHIIPNVIRVGTDRVDTTSDARVRII